MNHRLWMKWTVAAAAALAASSAYATEAVVSGDTYVSSSYPANNFGYQSNLHVDSTSTALIVFDLSSVPSATTSSQISKATLWLYVNRISSSGGVSLKAVTSTWSELAVTYNTIPTLGSAMVTFTPTVAQQFVAVDVTSVVQGWVTTPSSNYGIALSTASGSILFDSKENGETSHMAKLDITLVNQGPQGATGAPGAAGSQGPQGLVGATGATGSSGPIGATGPQGSPVIFRGPWNIGSTYAIGDTVSESGNSYIAIAAGTAADPATDVGLGTSGTYWALLAKKGDPGNVGAAGSAGAVGPQGLQGLTGATGAAGAQGQQGLTGAAGSQGPQGTAGATGATGSSGPIGATGPQGSPVTFRGPWNIGSTYAIGDTVSLPAH